MRIILGVTGSISAYKAVDIQRLFQKEGHEVQVVMTENAARFIAPLTFSTFSSGKVFIRMFDPGQSELAHIQLVSESDFLVIAPATANIIGKIAAGIADDLLSSLVLAYYKPIFLAPAMNCHMYENAAVQENLSKLRSRGIRIIEPESGTLACGDSGKGRLPPPEEIVRFCLQPLHE